MAFDDTFRILTSRSMTVASSGGASGSTSSVSAQTYAVDLSHPHTTAGVRVAVGSITVAASSTQSAFIPPFTVTRYKVSPGETIAAIGDGVATTMTIVELTK
jgi:hypothetical protein